MRRGPARARPRAGGTRRRADARPGAPSRETTDRRRERGWRRSRRAESPERARKSEITKSSSSGAEARAAHPGVELEMNRQRGSGEGSRGGRDPLGLGRVVERRGQAVGGEPRHVLGVDAREDEDLSGNPAPAQRRPLLGVRDREAVGPRAGEARRRRNRAVAVGVRLDHGVDRSGARPDSRGSGSWTRSRPDRRPPGPGVERRELRVESPRAADSLVSPGDSGRSTLDSRPSTRLEGLPRRLGGGAAGVVGEGHVVAEEHQREVARGAVALLGDDDVGDALALGLRS